MQSSSGERLTKSNPKAKANFCSLVFFGYTIPTFRQGWRQGFTEEDLYEILPEYKSRFLGDKLESAWREELEREQPSLFGALKKVYWRHFIRFCLILISMQLTKISQSVSLYFLMKFFEPGQTELTINHAYMCGALIVLPSFILVVCVHKYMLCLQHLGMKARIGCCSLVYRKCLKLSRKAIENTTIGQMVNLLSNDVSRFDFVCLQLPYLFDIPVEVVVTFFLLYYFGNIYSFLGVGFFILQIPIQIILGKKFSNIRGKTAVRTDERVRLMNEILSGIQVIKMHTWEESFAKLIHDARKAEIHQIRFACNIKSLLLSFAIITSRVAIFLSLVAYVILTDSTLSPEYVFMIVALFSVMRQSMTVALPNAISQIAEARVSIRRIEKFLLSEEMWSNSTTPQSQSQNDNLNSDNERENNKLVFISLDKVSAKWSHTKTDVLTDISFNLGKHDMMAVIGMVGSGKTSLLNLLLQELPTTKGKLDIAGIISYAAQEPWLFVGSIKQNIIFGRDYDHGRYNDVLSVCALKRDLSLFPYGDDTIIGERGVSLSGGQRARINLARAVYKEADIYLFDDPLSAVDTKVGNIIFDECIMQFLKGKCVILVTHQVQYLKEIPLIMILQAGTVAFLGDYTAMAQVSPELVDRLEEKMGAADLAPAARLSNEPETFVIDSRLLMQSQKETFSTGSVKRHVYGAYVSAGGNFCLVVALGFMFFATQFLASASDYFITFWVNTEQHRKVGRDDDDMGNGIQPTDTYIYIYSLIILITVILTLVRSIAFFAFCMQASVKLHKFMFYAIVQAPMSFFNNHPSGRILNRFSKDMGTIDDQFPFVTLDTIQIGMSVLGVIVVTIMVNSFTVFPIAIILVAFYFLRIYYLRTSRNIKRLEGIWFLARSPVFTQINTTMQGLSTIRAFKAEKQSQNEFDVYQDVHTSTWDTYLNTSRAFGFVLDLICCFYITIVTFSFLLFFSDTYGANVGLAITQSLTLTGMLQWGMRQWSEMENCMTSVERVYEYTQTETELNVKPTSNPPPYWPSLGGIEFKHVFLRYSPSEPYILRDLSFKVKPSQKVGIVGRTGAGKSSIIASLFQLAETEGQIVIDDIDIQTIPLRNLRAKIAIIPQEPVLFAGTLRKNLDPFEEHSDTLLWKALEEVALLPAVLKLASGLYSHIYEGGSNFSVGQRQLLCLARAIVRSNKILVLDEATANVDPHTDALIQTTIKEKFRFCTVLTIAHRLHTILDSDKVLVMEAGRAKEFGYSYVLLQDKEGIFYSLVQNAGPRMQQEIMQIAKENYFMRKEKGVRNPPKPLEPEDTLTSIQKEGNDENKDQQGQDSGNQPEPGTSRNE